MLLSRPVVLDLAESADAWFRLDTQLRAATAAPVERHARQVSQVRGFLTYGPQISTAVGGVLAEQFTQGLT